jgi:isoamylase
MAVLKRSFPTRAGRHVPPGASADSGGVNFSIFSRAGGAAELRLYEDARSEGPFQVIPLTVEDHRTFLFWHVYLEGVPAGVHYTWRVAAEGQPIEGTPELLDPWARAVSDAAWDREASRRGATAGTSLRAIVTGAAGEGTGPPAAWDLAEGVIYELHVGGFTRHPSAGVRHPGTFAGLVEKIPYLRELGVTHVELLPVMAFDEQDVPPAAAARGLRNYWGYSPYGFHAPHPRYCVDPSRAPQEFRDCVGALHEAGIGVLLDVVFNHTAEAGADGPTIHFKALDNDVFYHLDPGDPPRYRDYTGCGNTVNCNHPLVTIFIVRCLDHWARNLGVDGFRFDLASVFARGEDGAVLANPPLPWSIELSPALVERPLIAEAWDAAGLYHVGAFPGMRWAEWNGQYRDVMRRFVRGEPGLTGEVATRLAGSSDLYAGDHRPPASSINFITCHDGFTLADLVSYAEKHNEANGQDNGDGTDDNLSWNCGREGETDDPGVRALRHRQARNFMAILFLSQGVPMILAGDEVLRSQRGNNNAYCQDNELSWFDWRLADTERDMLRFVRELIGLRKRHPCLRRKRFLTGRPAPGEVLPDVAWHGERLHEPPWHDAEARLLAFTLAGARAGEKPLHGILNMSDIARPAALPELAGTAWRRAIDTALPAPEDITPPGQQARVEDNRYVAQPRSIVVLEGE